MLNLMIENKKEQKNKISLKIKDVRNLLITKWIYIKLKL
jgi:hypothetical protein